MQFVTKKTTELSKTEKDQLKILFEEVFEKESSVENFVRYYTSNYLGYSYHTLIVNDGVIVGSNSMVPIEYYFDGNKYPFVNAGGTMISKSARGIENYYDMIKESYRYAIENGFFAYLGFPNDNAHPLSVGTKLMKDIGKMYTYMLPYRVGGIKKSLRFLNPLSQIFCWCYLAISGLLSSKKVHSFIIHKAHESFDGFRYNSPSYVKIKVGKGFAVYRVMIHEGVRTAFIVDITEKSEKNYTLTVKEIIKLEKNNMDLILYVGNLPFKYYGLIRIPRKVEPKNFYFTGHILNGSQIDKKIFCNFSNWDVNLSNYDLI